MKDIDVEEEKGDYEANLSNSSGNIKVKIKEKLKFKERFKSLFVPLDEIFDEREISDEEYQERIKYYEEKYRDINLWEQIGFVRPLGGLFYNFVLSIIGLIIGLVFIGFLLNWLYPFPEAEGYRAIAGVYFSLMFSIFDIGTAYGIERFVAEYRIKDPEKMMEYLQFFIWYQMLTGLVQTTLVSIWALFIIPHTNLSYTVWILLIISTTQYPGFLGFFKAALRGLQQFNKTAILDFIGQYIFQMATNIIFILWGRWWGAHNPQIGELMGLTIGAAIGAYIDDFFATGLSIYFFNKTVKKMGFKWTTAFHHDYDKKLVWECFSFGVKVALGPLWGTAVGFIINMYWITYVPQWATFSTLSGLGKGIADIMKMGEGIKLVPATSESFLNGKRRLAQFYIAQTFKYWTFFALPMFVIILAFVPAVMNAVLQIQGAETYALASVFIFPWMIFNLQENVTHTADMIIVGASRPNFLMIIRLLEETGKLLLMTTWIVWLDLPSKYGLTAITWIVAMGIWPAVITKTIIDWWYINKYIVKVKISLWQTFAAPIFASISIYIISKVYLWTIDAYLTQKYGALIAGVVALLFALLVVFAFLYIFFYAFYGGFDDFGFSIFHDAVKISGPSRPLMLVIEAFLKLGVKFSPLHNKFEIPSKYPRLEAYELMEIREKTDQERLQNKN